MTRDQFIERAARDLKIRTLCRNPMLDAFAIKLNSEPTYDEREHAREMWEVFEKLGAKLPEES